MRNSIRTHLLSLPTLLALLTVLGCPLDIQVREREVTDAGCQGRDCVVACTSDFDCPDDQRCDTPYDECEPGPRLTQVCAGFDSCQAFANCKDGRCVLSCRYDCPLGYRCGPESECVEECTAGPPETLGRFCETSMDCTRCGFCVSAGGEKRCHQPCASDAECPGGGAGSCQWVAGGSLRVCRLPD